MSTPTQPSAHTRISESQRNLQQAKQKRLAAALKKNLQRRKASASRAKVQA